MQSPWLEEEPLGEEAPIQLSMLEHYAYCPRQLALIHIEQCYDDNIFTLKGNRGHERVDEEQSGIINGVRFERALPLFSKKLGLTGKADLIEFPQDIPYPVEYKHGSKSGKHGAEIQLCAQTLCLEEMFEKEVPIGALYSIKTHKRTEIKISASLKQETLLMIQEVRNLLKEKIMPPAVNDARCPNCSLIEICQPQMMSIKNRSRIIKAYANCFLVKE